jgi:hypothetical protein
MELVHSKKKGFYMPLIYYTEDDRKLLINSDQILTTHYSSFYKCFVVTLFNNTEIRLDNEQYDEIMEQLAFLEKQKQTIALPAHSIGCTEFSKDSVSTFASYQVRD